MLEESGEFEIYFSRSVVFPRSLLTQYDASYQEKVPELHLTDEEELLVQAEFETQLQTYETNLQIEKEATAA